jgi:hypothetical protein
MAENKNEKFLDLNSAEPYTGLKSRNDLDNYAKFVINLSVIW